MLNKDLSLQMVQFMLQAHGQETFGCLGLHLPVEIHIADDNVLGALNLVVNAGHRQTAFLADLHAIAFKEFGVDQNKQLILALGGVNDNYAFVHIDLRSGQTDPRRLVHRLGHVARQASNAIVNFIDRRSNLFQARIGEAEYWQ